MDKAIRGVLVGKLFELKVLKMESSFMDDFLEEGYDYKDVAAARSAFMWELAYAFFGDELPSGVHFVDGASCPRAFNQADHSKFWRAVEIQFRRSWVGRPDQELRQAFIQLRMEA